MKSLHCTAHNVQYTTRQVQVVKTSVWNRVRPRILQRIMDHMLEEIERDTAIIDNILIAGSNTEHHDAVLAVLHKVIKRTTSYSLKLNL